MLQGKNLYVHHTIVVNSMFESGVQAVYKLTFSLGKESYYSYCCSQFYYHCLHTIGFKALYGIDIYICIYVTF